MYKSAYLNSIKLHIDVQLIENEIDIRAAGRRQEV